MKGHAIREELERLIGRQHAGYAELDAAYEELLRRFDYWQVRQQDEAALAFEEGVSTYDLPMDRIRRLEHVFVQEDDDYQEWHSIEPVGNEDFERIRRAHKEPDGSDDQERPRAMRLFDGRMEVTPVPDGEYTVRLVYLGFPAPLTRYVVPILPENYHRLIAKKAAVTLLRQDAVKSENMEAAQPKFALASTYEKEVERDMFNLLNDAEPNRTVDWMPIRRQILRVRAR